MRNVSAFICVAALAFPAPSIAHGGGLDASGCHNDRKRGGYHCHGKASAPPKPQRASGGGSVYYANCAAARAAGAAPISRGEPGYGTHLDRDGDGKACE